MTITAIKSIWPEKQGFSVNRLNIGDMYIFVHFLSPVLLDQDGEIISVRRGGCIIFDKFSHQHFSTPDCPLTHDWFHLSGDITHLMKKYSVSTGKVYYPEHDEHITEIIQNMEIEFMSRKPHWEDICSIGCEEILARLTREADKGDSVLNVQKKEALIRLRTMVHLEYNKSWTVAHMAKLTGMSESRFYADYSKLFGISPSKDLQNTRIEHAKRMLRTGADVAYVAEQTGFSGTYHFIRQFKKNCGITPGKYSRTH